MLTREGAKIYLIKHKEVEMLYWAVIFFIVALISGIFGFSGIAAASAGIAQVLFYIFIIFFVITAVLHVAKAIDSKTKL